MLGKYRSEKFLTLCQGFPPGGAQKIGAGLYDGTPLPATAVQTSQALAVGKTRVSLQWGDADVSHSWGAILRLTGCPVKLYP